MDKLLASRLRNLGTEVVSLPQGMTRQKENHTTVNRKSGRINWQAEWFTFDKTKTDGGDANELNKMRTLSKLSDDVPLYKGYSALLETQAKTQGKVQKRAFRGVAQNPWDSHWHMASDCLQDPQTGGWISIRAASIDTWPRDDDESRRRRFQFFLESSKKRPDRRIILTPIQPGECLRNIVSNTKVIEFPAIYVLEEGEALPAGYVLGPKDMANHSYEEEKQQPGVKRKSGPQQWKKPERPAKRRRPGDKEGLEEGELGNAGGSDEENVGKAKDGAEADDVIAQQSLGEDEDDDTTSSDESTSSSGSDSE